MDKEMVETSIDQELVKASLILGFKYLDQYPDENPNVKPTYVVIAILSTLGIGGVGAITRMSKLIRDLQELASRTESQASITEARLSEFSSITEARLSEFSQALTEVRNSMADISQIIQTDAVTTSMAKALAAALSENPGEITNNQLNAMDNLVKRIETLAPKWELRESI